MLTATILFLPAMVCLFWALMTTLRKQNAMIRQYQLMMLFFVLYFVFFAYSSQTQAEYAIRAYLNVVTQWVAVALIPYVGMYVYSLNNEFHFKSWASLMFLPAVIQGTLATFLFFTIGPDTVIAAMEVADKMGSQAPQLSDAALAQYEKITTTQFHIICIAELLCLFVSYIWEMYAHKISFSEMSAFFFGNGKSTTGRAIVTLCLPFPLLLMAHGLLLATSTNTTWLVMLIAVLTALDLFYIGFFNYAFHTKECTLASLTNYSPDPEADIVAAPKASEGYTTELLPEERKMQQAAEQKEQDQAPTDQELQLFTDLTKVMDEEKLFIDSNLTLDSLAARLNTNRTYLSRVISIFCQTGFREYVNLCRIEYAMHYMREHPNDTQEIVAMRCGFRDAPSFSRKFKEYSGKTPRHWAKDE